MIAEDFEIASSQDLNQTFPSGSSNGTLCITVRTFTDTAIEAPEMISVTVDSIDSAVVIVESEALMTILDNNTGEQQ